MRIVISTRSTTIIDRLTVLYNFKNYAIIARIAFAVSLKSNVKFSISSPYDTDSKGRDWRDSVSLFGVSQSGINLEVVYVALLQKYYGISLSEELFIKLFKLHLDDGLEKISNDIASIDISTGEHIIYLINSANDGLQYLNSSSPFAETIRQQIIMPEYRDIIKLNIGSDDAGNNVTLPINDLKEFDSCNIAIAGMVGSGKTELVKDLLYQISIQTENKLKFIFFDYKGEGSPDRLKSFLDSTNCIMVDLKKEPIDLNPLSFINLIDKRAREFNIRTFVDSVCDIATQLGARQKNILQTATTQCFENLLISHNSSDDSAANYPTLAMLNKYINDFYEDNNIAPDSLLSIMSDLACNIFTNESTTSELKIYEKSLYINLPAELSDTLRQLSVFLILRYLFAEFSSSNDTEPTSNRIKPLRYVIVIDEAHVYLKNRNASKALETIIRTMRSKGVVIILLTQGVDDYKTKNFDFSSQIKIPICLNVNNKDYRLIESFVGTPRSKQKLQDAILNLSSSKGLINISEPKILSISQFWKRDINA